MKGKVTCIILILIIFVNIFMPILSYADDNDNIESNIDNVATETEAYYSSVSLAVDDANNNTIKNADSNEEEGTVSVKITEKNVNIKLLKNCSEENELQILNNIDLNLNGKELNLIARNSEEGYGFLVNKYKTLNINGEVEGSAISHEETLGKPFIMFQVVGNLNINGGKYINNVNDSKAWFVNTSETSVHNISIENIELTTSAKESALGVHTSIERNNSTVIFNNNECIMNSIERVCIAVLGSCNLECKNNDIKSYSEKGVVQGIALYDYGNGIINDNKIELNSNNSSCIGINIYNYSRGAIYNNEINVTATNGITYGIKTEKGSKVNIDNNQMSSISEKRKAYGIVSKGIAEIKDLNLKVICREIQDQGSYGIRNNGVQMIIKDSNIVCDAPSNNYGSTDNKLSTSTGINSSTGELKLYNVNVETTDYGVAPSGSTRMYVKGGTFQTHGHGPFYFSNGFGENHIEGATLIGHGKNNYDGEFSTENWISISSCMYMGGGTNEDNSGVSAYLNNCIIDDEGTASGYFVLRGSSGEKNLSLYISNSEFIYNGGGRPRFREDHYTDNVYLGSGNTFTNTNILFQSYTSPNYPENGTATMEDNVHETEEIYKAENTSYLQLGESKYNNVYIEGEKFDRTNLEIKYINENGEENIITDYEIVNEQDILVENQESITVKYNELELQVPIKVFSSEYKDLMLEKNIYCELDEIVQNVAYTDVNNEIVRCIIGNVKQIEVTTLPTKTSYVKGEELDLSGIEVTATYEDGTTGVIELTADKFTGYDKNTAGEQTVTVTYGEGITATFTVNVFEEIDIKTNNYEIIKDSGVNYLEKIKPNTNIETLKENITTNGTIEIYKDNMKVIDEKQLIATGMEIVIKFHDDEVRFVVVVTGDLTGDGKMSIGDLSRLSRYTARLDELEGAYLRASDITEDGKYASISDISKMSRVLAGMDNL